MASAEIEKIRHSLSHVMAYAVKELYPTTTFGIGPAIENGFYYDIDFGKTTISDADFPKIEAKMREIIKKKLPVERVEWTLEKAKSWAKKQQQKYKLELLNDLEKKGEIKDKVSFYKIGDFYDLCKGPHVDNTATLNTFKLTKVAGAYWKGDEKRVQMTRLYGVGFETKKELDEYLERQEQAKLRDHRKLGKELDLFHYSKLIGSGLPLFSPRGAILRDKLNELSQSYRLKNGYQKVWIPHIANLETYRVSGHLEKFPELLHFVSQESGDELALKPVNCPHHTQIFASMPRSYKDLPVKYLDTTTVYRDEKKGELGGLSRVRAITQDDSHIFCTDAQVEQVFGELIEVAKEMYELLNMKLSLRLSFKDDGDGYIGDEKLWAKAQNSIEAMAQKFKMDYKIGIGEAAMYGPKMDFMAIDALDREWQVATVQLDYALPERFGLEYVAADGAKQRPVMVHCALLGSIERFMGIFIEHTAGWFPLWCAPEQVRILTVNDNVADYAQRVAEVLGGVVLNEPIKHNELRFSVDNSSESLGKKIKRATEMRIPIVLIVGAKDEAAGEVSVRLRSEEQKVKLTKLAEFVEKGRFFKKNYVL
ncbi:MAG: threonine--tRNA ligase [Candidatus Nomurabacteria bacterium]|jgi:threonyl-tRNA synthetase|nr:threonine--tRNA ligase [Candidatus Nomurabacteria bacterium]